MTVVVLFCIGLLVSADGTRAQQKTLKDQLVGAWTLVSNDTTAPDGSKQQPFGGNPKGVLILDASGRYASVTGRPDRAKFKATRDFRTKAGAVTTEEWAAAAQSFGANTGTWSVNEADKTLIRKFDVALIPNNEGNETKAAISVTKDELKLTATPAAGGKNETVFRRAK